ncbi:MAG: hypothetical protein BWK77_06020 [Verrucomicrobia bacterium A1]|nr:MAG: hypothetical protein BWK77_06020 [Verrucomicrobia bacterium A1]
MTSDPKTAESADVPVAKKKFDPARIKAAMTDAVVLARRLGAGAVGLYKRLMKIRSPQEMLQAIDAATEANEARSGQLSDKLGKMFGEIGAKKKIWAAAPPARKRILEAELKTLLATYTALEREQKVLLENRRVLAQVRGRMQEAAAYDMAGVTEIQIDEMVDRIDEKAGDAEARVDAVRDLEGAGRRRERESDQESFMEQLDQFALDNEPTLAEPGKSDEGEAAPSSETLPVPEKPDQA